MKPEDKLPNPAAEARAFRQLGLLALLVIAIVAAVYVFLNGPARRLRCGSIDRIMSVMDFYKEAPPAASTTLLVFGDSIAMSGFDAYTYDELSAGEGEQAFNLSRSASSIAELLYDLPQPVLANSEVLLLVSPLSLVSERHNSVHPQKADLYSIYGPPPDAALLSRFEQQVPGADLGYLRNPRWKHVLASHWRFEAALRYPIQSLPFFGRDDRATGPDMRRFCTDMKYPNWNGSVDAAELARELDSDEGKLGGNFHCEPGSLEAQRFIIGQLAERSRGLVLVMAPLNPKLRERMPAGYFEEYCLAVSELAAGKARLINFSDLLSADEFRDAHHYTPAGGTRLTREIHRRLRQGGS